MTMMQLIVQLAILFGAYKLFMKVVEDFGEAYAKYLIKEHGWVKGRAEHEAARGPVLTFFGVVITVVAIIFSLAVWGVL